MILFIILIWGFFKKGFSLMSFRFSFENIIMIVKKFIIFIIKIIRNFFFMDIGFFFLCLFFFDLKSKK